MFPNWALNDGQEFGAIAREHPARVAECPSNHNWKRKKILSKTAILRSTFLNFPKQVSEFSGAGCFDLCPFLPTLYVKLVKTTNTETAMLSKFVADSEIRFCNSGDSGQR